MKRCTTCGTERPLEQFAKSGFFEGRQTYKARCKPCVNEAMRAMRNDATRVHFENVREEESPHGKGIVKVTVAGWGYAPTVRRVPDQRNRRPGSGAVSLRGREDPVAVLTDDGSGLSGSAV